MTWTDLALILTMSVISVIASSVMFTTQMQFFCKLSDPLLGGTYMSVAGVAADLLLFVAYISFLSLSLSLSLFLPQDPPQHGGKSG